MTVRVATIYVNVGFKVFLSMCVPCAVAKSAVAFTASHGSYSTNLLELIP